MKVRMVFEVPLGELADLRRVRPPMEHPVYGDPVEDAMSECARECADVFACSWGDDDRIVEEGFFDDDFTPLNAFVGLGLCDVRPDFTQDYFCEGWRYREGTPLELLLMENAVSAIARQFGADVLIICDDSPFFR